MELLQTHNVDLASLSLKALEELEKDITAERDRRLMVDREELLKRAHELAAQHGIPVKDILKPPSKKGTRKKRATKSQEQNESVTTEHEVTTAQ